MERLPMHRAREILRLRWVLDLGVRQAAASAGVGRSVVSKTTVRALAAGLDWAAVEALSDTDLDRRLYGRPSAPTKGRAEPDLCTMHTELRRTGVTLELLHLEYLKEHPGGYRYTAYCVATAPGRSASTCGCARCMWRARRRSSTTRERGRASSTPPRVSASTWSCLSVCSVRRVLPLWKLR